MSVEAISYDCKEVGRKIKRSSGLSYSFTIDNNMLSIIQAGDIYELRINNQVFSHIMTQNKIKNEFQFEENRYKNVSAAPRVEDDYKPHYEKKPNKPNQQKKYDDPEEDIDDFGFNKYDIENAKKDLKGSSPQQDSQSKVQFKMTSSSSKKETGGSDFKQFPGFSNLDNFGLAASSKTKTFQPNNNFNFNEFNSFGFQDQQKQAQQQQQQSQDFNQQNFSQGQDNFFDKIDNNVMDNQIQAQEQFKEVVQEQQKEQKEQQLIDLLGGDDDEEEQNTNPKGNLPEMIMQSQNQQQSQFDQSQQFEQQQNQVPFSLQQQQITQSISVNQQQQNMFQQQPNMFQQPTQSMQTSQQQQIDMLSLYNNQQSLPSYYQPQQQPQFIMSQPQLTPQMPQQVITNQPYGMAQSLITSQLPMQQQQQFYQSAQPQFQQNYQQQQFQSPMQQQNIEYTMQPTSIFEESKYNQKQQQQQQQQEATPFDLL